MRIYDAASGSRVIEVPFSDDPDKDEAWLAKQTRGMAKRDIRREYFMDETVFEGQPVFPDWNDAVHLPEAYRKAPMPIGQRVQFFGGWDAGLTMNPAFLLLQYLPKSGQIQALGELVAFNQALETFAPSVSAFLAEHFRTAFPIMHFGDETINTRSGHTGMTADDILRRHGFAVKPVSNRWEPRRSAVTWLLTDRITPTLPRFVVCGHLCPTLVDAMRGGYRYEELGSSESSQGPASMYKLAPRKDGFSHISDGLQYPAVELMQYVLNPEPATVNRRWQGMN